jgi:hypothetical protein
MRNFEASARKSRENTGIIGIGNDFPNRNQMVQQPRERIDKWDYMHLKSFSITKEYVL